MLEGIGVDILEVKRVKKVYDNHKQVFVDRILTENEKLEFATRSNKINYLAKQFSAKEAIAKSLGTGIGAVSFKDIEVLRAENGRPHASLINPDVKKKFPGKVLVSLSDTNSMVTAFAVYSSL